jgi:hypothetical protein
MHRQFVVRGRRVLRDHAILFIHRLVMWRRGRICLLQRWIQHRIQQHLRIRYVTDFAQGTLHTQCSRKHRLFTGLTKDYVCTPINPRQIGDECTANYQCLGDVTCNNGICAGGGAGESVVFCRTPRYDDRNRAEPCLFMTACAADDGTPSGPTAQCTSVS